MAILYRLDPHPGPSQLVNRLESAQDPLQLVPAGERRGPVQPGPADVEQRRKIGGVERVPLVALVQNAAERSFRRTFELNPGYATAHHWYAEYLVWTILDALERAAEKTYVPAYYIAAVHSASGDWPRALEWLEKARRQRDNRLVFLRVDAIWDRFRDQTEFEALAREIGFE